MDKELKLRSSSCLVTKQMKFKQDVINRAHGNARFGGDIIQLWNDLDQDGSGEITLDEIDQESAQPPLPINFVCLVPILL
jgi:hypothetical protein